MKAAGRKKKIQAPKTVKKSKVAVQAGPVVSGRKRKRLSDEAAEEAAWMPEGRGDSRSDEEG